MSIIDALVAQARAPVDSASASPMNMLTMLAQMGALSSTGGGFGGGGGGMPPGAPGGHGAPPHGGGLASWIDQAERAAGVSTGPFMDKMLRILVKHESGGDPDIVNQTPTPGGYHAEGLAQMIPPTFQSYNIPGLGGIDNPVANLAAAIRYMKDRYGSVRHTPGIASVLAGRGYQPY